MIEFIRAEYWQFLYLALLLFAIFSSFRNGTDALQKAALLLAAGWIVTNVFWMSQTAYIAADAVCGAMMAWLWFKEKESPLSTLMTLYGAMLFWHLIAPADWLYMAVLNVLFAWQCLVVISGCSHGRATHLGA